MKPSATAYLGTVLEKLSALERLVDLISAGADAAAERFCSGGTLCGSADEEGFESELNGRSGGFMGMKAHPEPSSLCERDVLVAGTLGLDPNGQAAYLEEAQRRGAFIVLVGSAASPLRPLADLYIVTGVEPGTAPAFRHEDGAVCPLAPVLNIAALWVFSAELLAACTRRGRMPAMYQSACVPDGGPRNARYAGQGFHEEDEFTVLPIPAGEKGREYLLHLYKAFAGLLTVEAQKLELLGERAAAAISRGGKVWCESIGHHLPSQRGLAGDPGIFTMRFPERGEKIEALSPSDFYVYNGYFFYPEQNLAEVREAGIASAWLTGGREVVSISGHQNEIHIDAHWGYGDACVAIPGYDVRVLPPSGVVTTANLWACVAQTMGSLL